MRPGVVAWIGLRPVRREPLVSVPHVELDPDEGLIGDHYRSRTSRTRQVTLIQAEHLAAIAAYLGRAALDPALLRRNIVVSGINLHALKGQPVHVGSAILLVNGECHPCSRMEEILGSGGYNAVRGHGGIIARVLRGGTIALGDTITRAEPEQTPLD